MLRRCAPTARGSIERVVVQQEGLIVCGELRVELNHPVTVLDARIKPRERVFRRELAAAPVRHEPRVRPAGHFSFVFALDSVCHHPSASG
jgi:hypothetical protein